MNEKAKALLARLKPPIPVEERISSIYELQNDLWETVNEIVPPGASVDEMTDPSHRAFLLLCGIVEEQRDILREVLGVRWCCFRSLDSSPEG